jgi:uncharacterized membrane protein YqjE
LRSLVFSLLGLARNRLELLRVEVQEEVLRLGELLLLATCAAFSLALGLGFLSVLLTVLLWDGYRVLALAVFTAVFLTLGAVAVWLLRARVARGSSLLNASLDELAKDQERLGV